MEGCGAAINWGPCKPTGLPDAPLAIVSEASTTICAIFVALRPWAILAPAIPAPIMITFLSE